jgi:hypothetical protein
LVFFVLCTLCCQFLWVVLFWLHLRYSLTFIFYPFFIFLLIYWILELFRQCRFFWYFFKFYYECEVQYKPIVSLSYGHCIFCHYFRSSRQQNYAYIYWRSVE